MLFHRLRRARPSCVFAALACAWLNPLPASAEPYSFYEISSEMLPGPPGSIIRTEVFAGAPWGTHAARVLYRSIGLAGEPIAVSAVVVAPVKASPAEGRPIVAWAHPTTGVARKCAPSLMLDQVMPTITGLNEMVTRGYVVVATDYPGLGTQGEHPYLVGLSEGRAVLDSVRAARSLTSAGNRFAVWGHSQGGHAALWTAELAATYAPELDLVGAATAAPASELAVLLDDDLSTTAGQVLTALSLWSWSRVFDASLASVVLPHAIEPVGEIGEQCVSGFADLLVDASAVVQIDKGFLKGDPAKIAPWSTYLTESTPGNHAVKWPPVFIAQGSGDTIVDPPVTTDFAIKLCNQGISVRYFSVPGASHDVIATVSAGKAVEWIADRFAEKLAPTDCVARNGASH
jgi:acetyl esterase/lipase